MASFGRRFEVTLQEGTALKCVRRGKRTDVACGDKVDVALTGPGEGVIESTPCCTALMLGMKNYWPPMWTKCWLWWRQSPPTATNCLPAPWWLPMRQE